MVGDLGDGNRWTTSRWRENLISALASREHSRKPDAYYELVEAYFPHLPKIELFARRARPGGAGGAPKRPPRRKRRSERQADPANPNRSASLRPTSSITDASA